MDENFYQFIVLKSIEETPITKLSPFLIQKTIETFCKQINIKKAMNNIIIQTTNQKQSEKILKWKQFGELNIKTYPPPTLNFSKGVIKSPDLASCFLEEIRLHLKPQGVTDVRRISICNETRTIDTNTYILTFNKPTTPTSIRIGYINTKIETYIPNSLRCQKCRHPKDKCTRLSICTKCGNSKIPLTAQGMRNVEKRKRNYRNKIHKKHFLSWGQKNSRTNTLVMNIYRIYQPLRSGRIWHKVNF